jgi:hypothetical protein
VNSHGRLSIWVSRIDCCFRTTHETIATMAYSQAFQAEKGLFDIPAAQTSIQLIHLPT